MQTPKRTFILSSPYPTGVTWLFNALLELRVKTCAAVLPHGWSKTAQGYALNDAMRGMLEQTTPILHHKKYFDFEPGIQVENDHRLAWARRGSDSKYIIFIRDVRDAIYSHYRREPRADMMSLIDCLRQPEHHEKSWGGFQSTLRGLFHMPAQDLHAYYYLFWKAMSEYLPVLVVRFEDSKTDPAGTLKRVADFLEISREKQEIEKAVEGSSFSAARKVAEKLEGSSGGNSTRQVRRGKVGEWREVLGPLELEYFSGPAAYCNQKFGYDTEGIPEWEPKFASRAAYQEVVSKISGLNELFATAERLFQDGKSADAEGVLWQSLPKAESSTRAFQYAANLITSLRWVRTIFSDENCTQQSAQRAFSEFVDLNARFGDSPAVQYSLATNVRYLPMDLTSPGLAAQSYSRGLAYTHQPRVKKGVEIVRDGAFYRVDSQPIAFEEIINGFETLANKSDAEAAKVLEQAIVNYPFSAKLRLLLAQTLMHLGDRAGAILEFERATFLDPNCIEAIIQHAKYCWTNGECQRGIDLLVDALTWEPYHQESLELITDWLVESGEIKRAAEYMRIRIELFPENYDLAVQLVCYLLETEDFAETEIVVQEALNMHSDDFELHQTLGLVRLRLGNAAGAKQAFEAALKLNPNDQELQNLLGQFAGI